MLPSPLTPPTQSPRNLHYDSPFSDYFTDITNSPPPPETDIWRRFNRSSTQILTRREYGIHDRDFSTEDGESDIREVEPFDTIAGAHEAAGSKPISQIRMPSDLVDSGLFLEDADDSVMEPAGFSIALDQRRSEENDRASQTLVNLELETATKDLLDRITQAFGQLQKRYEEVKYINELVLERMETATNEKLSLRSENDALRLDLHTTITEMLFLKLQLRDIEVKVAPFSDEVTDTDFAQQLDQWTQNWQVTDHRIRGRKATYDERSSCHNTPIRSRYKPENGHSLGHRGLESGLQRLRIGERAVSVPIFPSDSSSFSSTLSTDVSSTSQGDVEDTVIATDPESSSKTDRPSEAISLTTQFNNTIHSAPQGLDAPGIKTVSGDIDDVKSIQNKRASSDISRDRDTPSEHSTSSGDVPIMTDPAEEPQPRIPAQSRWSALWDALADAAGVLDYAALLQNGRE